MLDGSKMDAADSVPSMAESWLRTRDVLLREGPEDFGSLLLSAPVLEGLKAAGFLRPSPVQLKAIPLGRCGLDLIVQAKSGTGKTCVFSTIALDSLILENSVTQILVLAPTREIAVQIHAVITTIGIKMEGLECHVFIGGTPVNQDKMRLKKCHIAVGSPGRIKQLIDLDYLNTSSIRLFILDEADKLLEEGSFQEQVNWIYSSLPANKQMLAVSATYPESLANTLTKYMREPTFVKLNSTDPSLLGLKQYYKVVNSYPLPHKTFEEKAEHLQELFRKIPFNQALVFSNLHSRAQHLADILSSKGFPAECISGSMNQNQRLDAMAKLKQFHCRVLISTDLTSRGIDAEKVNLVVNLDVPLDWETYMHRIGRAGRFGTLGLAVTYCCRGEEENMMMKIAQKCNLQLLSLPETLPPELLEHFEGGHVEVTAVPYPNASAHTGLLPTKRPEGTRQPPTISASTEMIVSDNCPVAKPKHKLLKNRTEHAKTTVNRKKHDNIPLEKYQVESDCETAVHNNEQVDKESLRNMLPKIPCLSSFKNQDSVCLWSMVDFIEDYEYFIKEGLERDVEIIRTYANPRKQLDSSDLVGMESSKYMDATTGTLAGESDDDSISCSSESSICSEENQSCIKTSSDIQQTNNSILSNDRVHPQQFSPALEQKQNTFLVQKKMKGNVKQSKQIKRDHYHSIHQMKTELTEEASQRKSASLPHNENLTPDEYWRRYYRAWRNHYIEASRLYYQKYQRPLNMLTAYHANAIYLEELLKKDQ
ncbi:PREDICTED: probable ATP-dependent RNA helicase DDX20 [Thamnophis sirtalis]|uniref:Probable ATP-dependent RNA helicase DDX20 n=1 Tax=Thamnophis sirtalis TaxID=35019 RepID=A0A6I9YF92_9SAUR|nr:PREDICTED: probable ATP-dependent RNA helicase DDX20 [Thamnophis sirtalis]